MAQLSGKSQEELVEELNGVIFFDPVEREWQTADEYQKIHRYQKSQGGLRNAGRVSNPEKREMYRKHKSVQRKRYAKAAMVPGAWDQLQHVHALAEEPAK